MTLLASAYSRCLLLTSREVTTRRSIMSLAPPFTHETAKAKVKKAQDLWNTQFVPLAGCLCAALTDSIPEILSKS